MQPAEEAVVVVPARRASERLPAKLLLAESGRPLLAHTLERCLASNTADAVIAAVDGPELAEVAAAAGAEVVLTDPALPSGSDRVWAALRERAAARFIVNVQADEPEIEPEAIDALFGALAGGAEVATLSAPFPAGVSPEDPAAVKVVADAKGDALYFSRALVPFPRRASGAQPRLHVGLYGYQRSALERFATRPPSPLEMREGLEQLRFLEYRERVRVLEWPHSFAGIDTRSDYDAFLERQAQRT